MYNRARALVRRSLKRFPVGTLVYVFIPVSTLVDNPTSYDPSETKSIAAEKTAPLDTEKEPSQIPPGTRTGEQKQAHHVKGEIHCLACQ